MKEQDKTSYLNIIDEKVDVNPDFDDTNQFFKEYRYNQEDSSNTITAASKNPENIWLFPYFTDNDN